MQEIAKVSLETEMDLILAHKRSMKLAELAGLSLASQTTFATAVSEVSRITIDNKKSGYLLLGIDEAFKAKYIVARINDNQPADEKIRQGLEYAKKLVDKYNVFTVGPITSIELFFNITPGFPLDLPKLDEWRMLFRNEPPISSYDEIRRRNEQLQSLSDKVHKSEARYKTLTNSLPLIIFSVDPRGKLLYSNDWLLKFTGKTTSDLDADQWQSVLHPEDHGVYVKAIQQTSVRQMLPVQVRMKHGKTGDYLWHQLALSPLRDNAGELQYWIGYMADIHMQKLYEETLKDNIELKEAQAELKQNQQTLEQYIEELNRSNLELQQFAFVASHDLQEPLRKILFYNDYILTRYGELMDDKGRLFLKNMYDASHRMRSLIQDLLSLSLISKEDVKFSDVDLNGILATVLHDIGPNIQEKNGEIKAGTLPIVKGDARMLRQLFQNIVGNALKYNKPGVPPVVEISARVGNGFHEIRFTDNGIGFDEKYLVQMFALFKRLHARTDYEGTGLGLAICRKIMDVHNGRIWAESTKGEGASFFISLPIINFIA